MIGNKTIILKIKKPLYYCKDCNASTISSSPEVTLRAQKSNEVKDLIIEELAKKKQCYSQVARRYRISVSNIIYNFDKYELPSKDLNTISAINIDEVRFIPKEGKYQCVITNADTNEVIDILKNRYKPTVLSYFENNLKALKTVIQDCWDTYRSCAINVGANVVADKFHVVRPCLWAHNRTRIDIQNEKDIKLNKTWRLQNKSRKKLDKLGKRKVDKIINQDNKLKYAYNAKELYLHIFKKNVDEFNRLIDIWKNYVIRHKLSEFNSLLVTLENWSMPIKNMITSKYSNGSAERINRDIKQAKNQAFRFANLTRSKKLIILRSIS